jgi:hypothetical protein
VVCLAPRVPGEIVGPRRASGVVGRPLNFTVRFLRNRFRKPVARPCFCSYDNPCVSPGIRPSALRPWRNGAWILICRNRFCRRYGGG